MTEQPEPKRRAPGVSINYTEPQVKPPPLLEVGALAWIRKNLLSSPLDAILTVVGIFLVVVVIVGTVQWTVQQADWNAIILNLSNFMTGRLEDQFIPRISLVVLSIAFLTGAGVAAFTRRLSPIVPAILLLVVLPVLLLPPLARAFIPVPPMYLTAGNIDIVSGTATETPITPLGFIARAGETINLSYANTGDDVSLANIDGFMDRATNTLRNASANRMADINRYIELTTILISDAAKLTLSKGEYGELTPALRANYMKELGDLAYVIPDANVHRAVEIQIQLAAPGLGSNDKKALEDELKGLEIPPALKFSAKLADIATKPNLMEPLRAEILVQAVPPTVVETYTINQQPVHLRILNAGGESLGEWTLHPGEVATLAVPEDAWYILEKTVEGDTPAAVVLAADGIAPVKERGIDFLRLTDKWAFLSTLPKVDGENVRYTTLVENQYRGARSFQAFIRLYVTNFFSDIAGAVVGAALALAAGFVAARAIDRRYSPTAQPRKASRRLFGYLLVLVVAITFVLINGIDTLAVSTALAWVVAMVFGYQLGQRLYAGKTMSWSYRIGIAVAILPVIGVLYHIAPALLYRMPPTDIGFVILLGIPVSFAFLLGSFTGTGEDTSVIDRRLMIIGGLAVALYIVPVIIGQILPEETRDAIANFVPYTDPRTWGGLLLALFITIYGTILAFPLGIALALGRRSSLPAIKYPCTLIIEMVRGTPFIVVLFAGQLLIPLVNENFAQIPNVYRALGATVIFIAAYLAENVRGGLQSIPGGQQEAGRALGIPDWQITLFVTLPQALRAVIPALVGQIISLFKDTSLLDVVGLMDLSRTVTNVVAQAEFNDARREGLVFITIIYFVVSYVVAYISRRIEESGSGAARRI